MDIEVKTLRKIVQVTFPPGIDFHKLAKAVDVRDLTAWSWLKTGKVPEQYIAKIKTIRLVDVRKDKKGEVK